MSCLSKVHVHCCPPEMRHAWAGAACGLLPCSCPAAALHRTRTCNTAFLAFSQKWKWSIRVDKGGGVPGVTLEVRRLPPPAARCPCVPGPARGWCDSAAVAPHSAEGCALAMRVRALWVVLRLHVWDEQLLWAWPCCRTGWMRMGGMGRPPRAPAPPRLPPSAASSWQRQGRPPTSRQRQGGAQPPVAARRALPPSMRACSRGRD